MREDKAKRGLIFDIQRFCLHDGPGIRTVIFFKGCPLRCKWCQNPEGLVPETEIGFSKDKCTECHECEKVCFPGAIHFDSSKRIDHYICDRCGKCAEVCYAGALQLIGKYYSPEELLKESITDIAFFNSSGGGITLSGGEPTYQIEFLANFLPLAKQEGLHIAVETCGYIPYEKLKSIIPLVDLILYDIKTINPVLHKKLTGQYNEIILKNFDQLLGGGVEILVRIPLIPSLTATEKNLEDIANFLKDRNIQRVNLLPYHKMGEVKLKKIDSILRPLRLKPLNNWDKLAQKFKFLGIKVIGG